MRIRQGITAAHNLLLQSAALDFPAWWPGAPPKVTCELQAEQVCRGGEWLEVGMVWKGGVEHRAAQVPDIPLQFS